MFIIYLLFFFKIQVHSEANYKSYFLLFCFAILLSKGMLFNAWFSHTHTDTHTSLYYIIAGIVVRLLAAANYVYLFSEE